jgi:hypothetical protein
MPKGHGLAQCSGVGDETVECVSLRKLRYFRHRSRILCANTLVLERAEAVARLLLLELEREKSE